MQRYLLCIILGMLLLFTGCSGGDEGSTSSSDTQNNSSISASETQDNGSGSVAIMLTDGPADEYDHIWVWITEISLLSNDENADPVVVYVSEDPEGWKVDLLDLRDQEAVVTVNNDIPAGHYPTIRLHIADVQPEGDNAPCDNMELELPDGKIDIEPKGGISVVQGETIAVHIDIDCDKSIDLEPIGRRGTCVFRPRVFVETDKPDVVKKCPRVLRGKIETIQDGNSGFTLRLGHGRGLLMVNLAGDVVIFGKNGMPVPPEDLGPGQLVHVRGQLDRDGNLEASAIVIGYVLLVKGMVETPYDAEAGEFSLNLMLSKILPCFPDFIIDIDVSETTLVMAGCDQMVHPSAIQAGMKTRVVAKLSNEDWSIKAVAVQLKDVKDADLPEDDTDVPKKDTDIPDDDPDMPTGVSGVLMDVSGPDDEGDYALLVESSGSETYAINLPAGVEPFVEVIGQEPHPVSIDELAALTGCAAVSITIDSQEPSAMMASDVLVDGAVVSDYVIVKTVDIHGTITASLGSFGPPEVIHSIIAVPGSLIDSPFMTIEQGGYLEAIGLNTCGGDNYYQAIEIIQMYGP